MHIPYLSATSFPKHVQQLSRMLEWKNDRGEIYILVFQNGSLMMFHKM